MAVIKVRDLAYGRLQSPDLDQEEEFLTAFGMVRAARTPTALYMRGTDPAHHIHVTEKGDPRFIGFAWAVEQRGRTQSDREVPRRVGYRKHRRARRRQACPPDRAQRLHHRGRARHRVRATDPGRASGDQFRRRAAEPCRRGHSLRRRAVQCEADRPCRSGFAEKSGDGSLVPRDARSGLLGRCLRRRQGQHHRAVQPDRRRRRIMSTITPSSA